MRMSAHRLERALAGLSIPLDKKATRRLFATVDTDRSGTIDFLELEALLKQVYAQSVLHHGMDDFRQPAASIADAATICLQIASPTVGCCRTLARRTPPRSQRRGHSRPLCALCGLLRRQRACAGVAVTVGLRRRRPTCCSDRALRLAATARRRWGSLSRVEP